MTVAMEGGAGPFDYQRANVIQHGDCQMRKIASRVAGSAGLLVIPGMLLLAGCSSSPDEAQMKQLNDLKDEYAALQKESATKEDQVATLNKEVADKNAKLKKCHDDQEVVRTRLAGH